MIEQMPKTQGILEAFCIDASVIFDGNISPIIRPSSSFTLYFKTRMIYGASNFKMKGSDLLLTLMIF
jgi:hypothetical protein